MKLRELLDYVFYSNKITLICYESCEILQTYITPEEVDHKYKNCEVEWVEVGLSEDNLVLKIEINLTDYDNKEK